jgi:hypothetical protein
MMQVTVVRGCFLILSSCGEMLPISSDKAGSGGPSMGITATAGLASITATTANAASTAANGQAAQAPPPKVNSGGDTVQLTVAQQVYQLYNQGQKVSEIASALSLSVAAVNSYLNLPGSGS